MGTFHFGVHTPSPRALRSRQLFQPQKPRAANHTTQSRAASSTPRREPGGDGYKKICPGSINTANSNDGRLHARAPLSSSSAFLFEPPPFQDTPFQHHASQEGARQRQGQESAGGEEDQEDEDDPGSPETRGPVDGPTDRVPPNAAHGDRGWRSPPRAHTQKRVQMALPFHRLLHSRFGIESYVHTRPTIR